MLRTILSILEIMLLCCFLSLVFLLIYLKRRKWEETPATVLETTILSRLILPQMNGRIFFIISLILFPIACFFLMDSKTAPWHFFAVWEISMISLLLFQREFKKMSVKKIPSAGLEAKKKPSLLWQAVLSTRRMTLLAAGITLVAIFLSWIALYHVKVLLSSGANPESEIIIITASLVGSAVSLGLLFSLPVLRSIYSHLQEAKSNHEMGDTEGNK